MTDWADQKAARLAWHERWCLVDVQVDMYSVYAPCTCLLSERRAAIAQALRDAKAEGRREMREDVVASARRQAEQADRFRRSSKRTVAGERYWLGHVDAATQLADYAEGIE